MEKDINEIISKSIAGKKLDSEERQLIDNWLENNNNKRFYGRVRHYCQEVRDVVKSPQMDVDQAYKNYLDRLKESRFSGRISFVRKVLPYAAVFIVMVGLFSVMMYLERDMIDFSSEEQWISAVEPGSKKAELILADGKVLDLAEEKKKEKIKEKDGTLIKNTGSALIYNRGEGIKDVLSFNSLVVPRGGEYQLELEDGTKVWMNSESRLRYPTQFSKEKRIVLLEGEAYFEVSKDKNRPFIVKTQGVDIRVLGTSFNVSSYGDEEDIKTTLVEGSVVVTDSKEQVKSVFLQPGYQAVYTKNQKKLKTEKVNVELYTSWRDGRFVFEKSEMGDIMNRVSRWYDVKVFYQSSNIDKIRFTGSLKRYDNLDRLLRMIEKTNEVHFVIGQKTIIVEKNIQNN